MVDRQEHRRAKQSCCQSKAVESSSLEGKHRDRNSFSEPAGDKTGQSHGGQLSMSTSGVLPAVRDLVHAKVKGGSRNMFEAAI